MKNKEVASISVLKIVLICIVLIFAFNIVTRAGTVEIKNVKIVLANNYELEVVTTNTEVGEILKENHIVLLPEEKVTPDFEAKISDNQIITITKNPEAVIASTELAEENTEVSMNEVLDNYSSVVEKIIEEEYTLPYETITKDFSNNAKETTSEILQEGQDGLIKITYKAKYQDDVEIERMAINKERIKEPVEEIVQINAKPTKKESTARQPSTTAKVTGGNTVENLGVYKITGYCSCAKCCDVATGLTASGKRATAGRTVAGPANLPFGTKVKFGDKVYVVEDRGGAIKGNRIDLYFDSHQAAMSWGVRYMEVEIVE